VVCRSVLAALAPMAIGAPCPRGCGGSQMSLRSLLELRNLLEALLFAFIRSIRMLFRD